MKNSYLKNAYEVNELFRENEDSKNASSSKIYFKIAETLDHERKERQNFINNSIKTSNKNSKNTSNLSSPSESLRKLKAELMNEKLSQLKKVQQEEITDPNYGNLVINLKEILFKRRKIRGSFIK